MHGPRLLALAALGLATTAAPAADPPEPVEFFEKKIRPVLVEHCYKCHSAEAEANKKLKAGLRLDTRDGLRAGGDGGPALAPGDPGGSLLMKALRYDEI